MTINDFKDIQSSKEYVILWMYKNWHKHLIPVVSYAKGKLIQELKERFVEESYLYVSDDLNTISCDDFFNLSIYEVNDNIKELLSHIKDGTFDIIKKVF